MLPFCKISLCFLLALFLQHSDASLTIRVSSSPVLAEEGKDVLLRCSFTAGHSPIDMEYLLIRWYFNGKPLANSDVQLQKKDRYRFFAEEFKNGNASLLLQKVELSSAGDYICDILYTPDKEEKTITLKVKRRPLETGKSTSLKDRNGGRKNAPVEKLVAAVLVMTSVVVLVLL
nr:PREDICTED: uncharacterized protein LOC106706270 [Latimeria chalumnae]|eukprot:XP_014352410.1 PREDICTED: uncharacterized protein LOC106706270 [Latimeria chalumnae]